MLYQTNEVIGLVAEFSGRFVAYFNSHMLVGIAAALICGSVAVVRLHAR